MPKVICKECQGTGLAFPLMDRDCDKCDRGQIEISHESKPPGLPVGKDGELAAALCDIEDLNDWEASFADSLYKQVEGGRELTEKQTGKAREILERYK